MIQFIAGALLGGFFVALFTLISIARWRGKK